MSRNDSALLKAKRMLYSALLNLQPIDATDSELNLMNALMTDPQLQKFLNDIFEKERKK